MYSMDCFLHDLKMGREIEFHLYNQRYFISWNHSKMCFDLYNENQQKTVFSGTEGDLLIFPLYKDYTIGDNFGEIMIDYVL